MSQDEGHERSAARAASESPPDREFVERPNRRRFTAKYKVEILEKTEACTRSGEVGDVLRREGCTRRISGRGASSARTGR